MPISEEQFTKAIDDISEHYEQAKDYVHASCPPLNILGPNVQGILRELAKLRDVACTALRASHTTQNFNDN